MFALLVLFAGCAAPAAKTAIRPTEATCQAARDAYELASNAAYYERKNASSSIGREQEKLAEIQRTLADCVWPPPTERQCLDAMDQYGAAYYELALVDSNRMGEGDEMTAGTREADNRVRVEIARARETLFACFPRHEPPATR